MDKALGYMALARKAGRIELGEEPVGAAAAARKACLIVAASDASDHTWRRANSFAAGQICCIRVNFTKDQLGQAIGRESLALAAFTDAALSLAFVRALNEPQKFARELAALEEDSQRASQVQNQKKRPGSRKSRPRPAAKKEH